MTPKLRVAINLPVFLKCKMRKKKARRFVLVAKRRVKVPGVPSVERGNKRWDCDSLLYRVIAFREQLMRCFVKNVLERITPYTLIQHTKIATVFGTGRSTNYIRELKHAPF